MARPLGVAKPASRQPRSFAAKLRAGAGIPCAMRRLDAWLVGQDAQGSAKADAVVVTDESLARLANSVGDACSEGFEAAR
jgi:hypothetical protein